jgi:glutamate/tyrosine decarboxylase-like PLP-dependent enzyme
LSKEFLMNVAQIATDYDEARPSRRVGVLESHEQLISWVDSTLPNEGEPPEVAIQALITSVQKGLMNSTHPRYFGFVIGGSTAASTAADWLTSTWDQNAQVYNTSPAASIIQDVVAHWLLDLLALPQDAGVGFVTGTQMANFTALTAAKNAVLQRQGWDVELNGLQGAPHISVVCGECCHGTIHSAVRLLGLGQKNIHTVRADGQGRIDPDALRKALDVCSGPTIICAQAGNANTGAFDPFDDIVALAKEFDAWLHIDSAFGLWAGASPRYKHLVSGVDEADSWATDAHKWLNVPYDSGLVIIRDRKMHQDIKTMRCAYAGPANIDCRDGSQWAPENPRRARGFVLYAALRNLGRQAVSQLIDNCCARAQEFASLLAELSYVRVINEVVLNQVLFRLESESIPDLDAFNTAVAARVQQDGICWIGTTQWLEQTALRIFVSNWSTTEEDVCQSMISLRKAIDKELTIRHER